MARNEGNRNATIIAVSGYGGEHARQTALAAGFDDYLTKPADIGRLMAMLEQCSRRRLS